MGPGDMVFFAALMVGIVLVFRALTAAYKHRIDYRMRSLELKALAAQPRTPERGDDYKQLEQRIRVLERIATDRAPNLASQIEALRDMPRAGDRLEVREMENGQ